MRNFLHLMLLAVFLVGTCPSAMAAEDSKQQSTENLPWEKASINLGYFISSTNSGVRLSAKGLGVSIDVEDALGLESTTNVFRTGGFWRFSDNLRHRADLTWFALRRDGYRQLGQDIVIDGVTYPTGTTVNVGFDIDVYKASYSYSFLQDDRIDIAASIGLYVMPIAFELSATGLLQSQVSESITAPLPVFGLRADFALTPKWLLRTHADLFYLEYKQFKGAVYNTSLALEYKAFKRVGFGVSTEMFNLGVEAEGEDYPQIDLMGKIEYRYLGAMLYGRIYF